MDYFRWTNGRACHWDLNPGRQVAREGPELIHKSLGVSFLRPDQIFTLHNCSFTSIITVTAVTKGDALKHRASRVTYLVPRRLATNRVG
jgi:hypothetical protein